MGVAPQRRDEATAGSAGSYDGMPPPGSGLDLRQADRASACRGYGAIEEAGGAKGEAVITDVHGRGGMGLRAARAALSRLQRSRLAARALPARQVRTPSRQFTSVHGRGGMGLRAARAALSRLQRSRLAARAPPARQVRTPSRQFTSVHGRGGMGLRAARAALSRLQRSRLAARAPPARQVRTPSRQFTSVHGRGGIRTHAGRCPHDFQSCALSHSATRPAVRRKSGRPDSNRGPLRPERSALPD